MKGEYDVYASKTSQKGIMDIVISSYEKDPSSVFKSVRDYFSREFPTEKFEWKRSGSVLTTSLSVDEKEIADIFEELVKKHPQLYVEASYSYDVREDDRSAQWWGTTRIYSEKENGETKIVSSSSTYWN